MRVGRALVRMLCDPGGRIHHEMCHTTPRLSRQNLAIHGLCQRRATHVIHDRPDDTDGCTDRPHPLGARWGAQVIIFDVWSVETITATVGRQLRR